MLTGKNDVYVAVEGEEEIWIRFELEDVPGTTLPVAVTPEDLDFYVRAQGYDVFQLKAVRLEDVLASLREDELVGVTHVTVAEADGPSTYDKATFMELMD